MATDQVVDFRTKGLLTGCVRTRVGPKERVQGRRAARGSRRIGRARRRLGGFLGLTMRYDGEYIFSNGNLIAGRQGHRLSGRNCGAVEQNRVDAGVDREEVGAATLADRGVQPRYM